MQKAINDNSYSFGIFLDLSKAFDTVNHSILLNKLDHYGISVIGKKWFFTYRSNRKESVSLSAVTSDVINISCRVPQGSVLGPILVLLYINDSLILLLFLSSTFMQMMQIFFIVTIVFKD